MTADEVFRAHGAAIHRWATQLGGPGFDADDAVQEVFIVVHQRVAKFVPGAAQLTTWLYEITRNIVRGQRRKSKWSWFSRAGEKALVEVPDERTPADALEAQRARQKLYAVLDRLSERDREVLILFELERMSGEEIAQLMDARVATVWVWLHRARKRFTELAQERQS
ncbi:MAG: sigma-70 family RNA polymerase sigma factor [Archangium sp.]|nr:sigma-70 family RNA polymerase sigma factor [Archangium sp.]